MRLPVLPALLLASAALGAPLSAYGNARFNYWVDIPQGLIAQRPPDNGDGQSWQSADGQVKLSVWGSHAPGVLEQASPGAWMAWTARFWAESGARVTYRRLLPSGFVLSGFQADGRIFYEKVLVRGGDEAGVLTVYPVARRAVWDRMTAQVAGSLRWGQR
ncbi:hypothetical protein [Deinococcus multiflagellatus]|uniref:Uncharacterized protein n=1 Tax=Deinococcus multiflagellatus TaxID=1656887 RepID=A0ABW1ZHH6_9DEIO|nr:hypothetical protein [Deinococcus multiflagellatus]MBZ9714253.1 hypothetical protein [Deinococcus multiflagellatus]